VVEIENSVARIGEMSMIESEWTER
jgi:hypothetical protein